MEFSIVKFPEENDAVAVVPNIWLIEGYCYWPPPGDISKLSRKRVVPDIDTWSKNRYTVIKEFGNLIFQLN